MLRFRYRLNLVLVVMLLISTLLLTACGNNNTATSEKVASTDLPNSIKGGAQSSFVTPSTTINNPTQEATTGATPKPGGVLRITLLNEPDQLDPHKTIAGPSNSLNNLIYARLVYIGRDGLPHPWLAETWQINDGGKSINFKLRSGITFHDGTPVNAAAVKFSFDRFLDPKTAAPGRYLLGTLQSVEVTGELEVSFKFQVPYASFFNNISSSYGGIVSPAAVAKYGDAFGRNPVGAGPFMFKSWKSGSEVTLERNPNYKNFRDDGENKGVAYLDQISFKIVPDPTTQLAALESGAADVVSSVDPQLIKQFSRFQVFSYKSTPNLIFMEYGNKAPFTDTEFRKALSYAVDKKTIVDKALNGFGTLNPNPYPVGVAGWDESATGYPYDPAKAKAILADIGWKPGANGLLAKDGKAASFTLYVPTIAQWFKPVGEIIQANLKDIGIEIKLQLLDQASFLQIIKKPESDMHLINYGWSDPSFISQIFKSPGWDGQFNDPEVDAAVAKVESTIDPAERLEAAKAAQKLIVSKALILPIFSPWLQSATLPKVKGYKWDALGNPILTDVWLS